MKNLQFSIKSVFLVGAIIAIIGNNSFSQDLKSAKKHSQTVVDVVKKVTPSVVSIHAAKIIQVQPHQYFNPFEEFFGEPFGRRRQKPESRQYKQQGLGSGVIVSKDGHVLTNHHVAGEADEIKIALNDDREFEAEVIGSDKLSDMAVLKIKKPPKDLPVAVMGNSDELEVGESVIAIGSPFGYSNTVTSGIISAKGRTVGINSYENYLRTDASINPGNSGGALVDLDGKLVGINTAIASRTGASHGIGFAIPINMAKDIMNALLDKGSVVRGYLGVYLQDLDKNLVTALGLKSNKGVLITNVIEDSPADKGGFKEGDVVIKADGKKIKDMNRLRNLVAMLKPGNTYQFIVIRDKKEKTLKIKIGERDDDKQAAGKEKESKDKLGLTLEDISPAHAQRYKLSRQSGVIVTGVKVGSKADKAGFMHGDIVLNINREKVGSVKDFNNIIKKQKQGNVLVLVERQGMKKYIGLNLK
jgi:serine protease Do